MRKKKLTSKSFHEICETIEKTTDIDTLVIGAGDGTGNHHYFLHGNRYSALWIAENLKNQALEDSDKEDER